MSKSSDEDLVIDAVLPMGLLCKILKIREHLIMSQHLIHLCDNLLQGHKFQISVTLCAKSYIVVINFFYTQNPPSIVRKTKIKYFSHFIRKNFTLRVTIDRVYYTFIKVSANFKTTKNTKRRSFV